MKQLKTLLLIVIFSPNLFASTQGPTQKDFIGYDTVKKMKRTLFIVFFLSNTLLMYSQPDCVIKYSYSVKIKRTSIPDTTILNVFLPGTLILVGYEHKLSHYDNIQFNSGEDSICQPFYSHMSMDFCNTADHIINKIFIGDRVKYTIFIRYGNKTLKKKINVRDIKFEVVDEEKFPFKNLFIKIPEIQI